MVEVTNRAALGKPKKCTCEKAYVCHHNKLASYGSRKPAKVVIEYRRNAKRVKQAGRPEEAQIWEEKAQRIDDEDQQRWIKRTALSIVSSPWGANEAIVDKMTEKHKHELATLRNSHTIALDKHDKDQERRRSNFRSVVVADQRKVRMLCRKLAQMKTRASFHDGGGLVKEAEEGLRRLSMKIQADIDDDGTMVPESPSSRSLGDRSPGGHSQDFDGKAPGSAPARLGDGGDGDGGDDDSGVAEESGEQDGLGLSISNDDLAAYVPALSPAPPVAAAPSAGASKPAMMARLFGGDDDDDDDDAVDVVDGEDGEGVGGAAGGGPAPEPPSAHKVPSAPTSPAPSSTSPRPHTSASRRRQPPAAAAMEGEEADVEARSVRSDVEARSVRSEGYSVGAATAELWPDRDDDEDEDEEEMEAAGEMKKAKKGPDGGPADVPSKRSSFSSDGGGGGGLPNISKAVNRAAGRAR